MFESYYVMVGTTRADARCHQCGGIFLNGHYCVGRPLREGEKTCTNMHCTGCDGCDPIEHGVPV